jgi:hypothetical protein
MDADNLSLRLEALEASVAEYVVADHSRWQAVHARITAYEIAVELMCNVAQRRDPTLVRDLIEGLVFVETETRLTNFHDASCKSSSRTSSRPEPARATLTRPASRQALPSRSGDLPVA